MVEQVAKRPIVTITGVTGFIGAQVCFDFLKAGKFDEQSRKFTPEFEVRGTVRDPTNEDKIGPLRKSFVVTKDDGELVYDFFKELTLV
jgi:nucleoside-diphosphate-sugar epimerase